MNTQDQATLYASPAANGSQLPAVRRWRQAEVGDWTVPAEVLDLRIRSFRLTPAEAAFAKLLISGMSVRACAVELGVSIHTVRSHLKRVMVKTNTNRQIALIGLLCGVPQIGTA